MNSPFAYTTSKKSKALSLLDHHARTVFYRCLLAKCFVDLIFDAAGFSRKGTNDVTCG
jgi:hypothetical protein